MQPIILKAVVDEKRRIMIDLPDDVPTGEIQFKLFIFPETQDDISFPDDTVGEIDDDELQRFSQLFAVGRPLSEYVDEDREERF